MHVTDCQAGFEPIESSVRDDRLGCLGRCWLTGALLALSCLGGVASAAEPHQRFVERLRDERFFDLALLYLQDVEQRPDLDAEFRQVVDLERALLYFQSAASLPPKSPQRAQRLEQAEQSLKSFIQSHPQHPRRSEARLKLGGLLRMRAEEARAGVGADHAEELPQAVHFFDEAHKLFESTIAELVEIENGLKGGRVDPNDSRQVAYRERVRAELREAQLLSAKAVEDRGRSRAVNGPQWRQDLEQALQMFSDLYSKEQRMVGIRHYALFYRSGIQQSLGRVEDAIDGYQRIIDLEGIEPLRPLQTEAVDALIKALAAEGKFEPAADRASRWIAGLRGDEKNSPEAIALSLSLARVRLSWIEALKSTEPGNRLAANLQRATRSDLRGLLRIAGPHQDSARQLLAALGVEQAVAAATVELTSLKNLGEAVDQAQTLMDNADTAAVGLAVVEEKLADTTTPAEERASLESQRAETQAEIDRQRELAFEVLRAGLRLFDSQTDDRGQLFSVRFRMAFALLRLGRAREAIAVADFLSRTSPGTSQGLNAAALVLRGFSELLQSHPSDQPAVMAELAPFAEYLVATWPQSTEAAAASGALTQLAIAAQDWDRAERYLGLVPETSPGVAQQYFELGGALFDQHQRLVAAGSATGEELVQLRQRAQRWLQQADQRLAADDRSLKLSVRTALAQLLLADQQIEQAAQLLISGDQAPLQWLSAERQGVSAELALEAYRTALRIVAAGVADGQWEVAQAAEQIRQYIDQLQVVAAETATGSQRLQAIFAGVGRDLKDKLALVRQPAQRAQFAQVVLLLVGEAARSDSFGTQYWAASTLLSLAEELAGQTDGDLAAKDAYAQASQLLQRMIDTAAERPGWAQPEGVGLQLKVLLAKASEGAGDYRQALQVYGAILDENENLLDVQISVARALQRSAADHPARYESAIMGARPSPRTKNNVFWGWGKISQVTSRRLDDYLAQFFESRYQLANCRMLWALSLTDTQARAAELARAERAIIETFTLYPELGGSEDRARYDALLKRIQRELGKPAEGLNAIAG